MSSAAARLDRAALEREAAAERRELLVDVTLTGVTLAGLLLALLLPRLGVSGAPITAIFVATYLAGGFRATLEAAASLRRGALDIDLLMVLAALAAAAVGEPRDGAFLLFLFSLAGVLEDYAMGRTKRAVTSLMDLRPDEATRLTGDDGEGFERVAVEALEPGDRVLVRPGEYLPVDGVVTAGESAVDQASITGESVPVDKAPGDAVFAGTVNRNAALTVRVEKRADATTLARMIELVTQAQEERAPSERFSDWFGQRYTVAVLVGSALALALFLLFGLPRGEAFYKAATLLVVASPCAVVISVPAAILSALAAAARRGVLFKGGAALEDFGRVDTVAFDKTGTLTSGRIEMAELVAFGSDEPGRDDAGGDDAGGDERALLALAAGIERHSDHPIALSLVAAAERAGVTSAPLADAAAQPGFGVTARQGDATVWAGKPGFAERFGARFTGEQEARLERLMEAGRTPVVIGRGATVLGVAGMADQPRPYASEALERLRERGVARFAMLTGDHARVARAVAAQLGLPASAVHADLLPDEKVDRVRELRAASPAKRGAGGGVAFIGDGINDAAALAVADVGVAMGSAGSDAALEAADVALLSDDLRLLADAHDLARRANRIVRQNLVFAIGIMAVMVLLTLFASLPLPLGVIGHEGGTLLVVANGLRLLLPARGRDEPRPPRRRPVPAAAD